MKDLHKLFESFQPLQGYLECQDVIQSVKGPKIKTQQDLLFLVNHCDLERPKKLAGPPTLLCLWPLLLVSIARYRTHSSSKMVARSN